jgi:hypothetical protein
LWVEWLRAFNLLRTSLPEREYIGFDPARAKGDLKGAVADRSVLPDQLVKPRLNKRSVPLVVDVESMGGSRRSAVEEHAERHGRLGARDRRTRWTSRAWKRNAIPPPAWLRTHARRSTVQSPERPQELSLKGSGSEYA